MKFIAIVVVMFMFSPQIFTALTVDGAFATFAPTLIKLVLAYLVLKYAYRGIKKFARFIARTTKCGLTAATKAVQTRTARPASTSDAAVAAEDTDTTEGQEYPEMQVVPQEADTPAEVAVVEVAVCPAPVVTRAPVAPVFLSPAYAYDETTKFAPVA